jgi:anti-anti-sigma regulatory factor/PAS domain-containing protein
VLDPQTRLVCWANDAALALWRAPDRAELYARDMLGDAPDKVRARVDHTLARVLAGERLCEEWVFYPRGHPTPVLLHMRAVVLPSGRVGMLNQAAPVDTEVAPGVIRAVTAMRHLSAVVAFASEDGRLRVQNPAAMEEFGGPDDYTAWFLDPDEGRRILAAARDGKVVRREARVRTRRGERWHAIEATALRDPVLGDLGVLLLHRDETARVEAEQVAADHLALVERQRREIVSLSAPILAVGERVLAIPIIGSFDAERARELGERLLATVAAQRSERVLLDLTGTPTLDPDGADRLRALLGALRLLGATPVLTGIQPALAAALAATGLDLGGVLVARSLADALRTADERRPPTR